MFGFMYKLFFKIPFQIILYDDEEMQLSEIYNNVYEYKKEKIILHIKPHDNLEIIVKK
jgi:hypothetical protein